MSCVICLEDFDSLLTLPCDHSFCLDCIKAWKKSAQNVKQHHVTCPTCRAEFPETIIEEMETPLSYVEYVIVAVMMLFMGILQTAKLVMRVFRQALKWITNNLWTILQMFFADLPSFIASHVVEATGILQKLLEQVNYSKLVDAFSDALLYITNKGKAQTPDLWNLFIVPFSLNVHSRVSTDLLSFHSKDPYYLANCELCISYHLCSYPKTQLLHRFLRDICKNGCKLRYFCDWAFLKDAL